MMGAPVMKHKSIDFNGVLMGANLLIVGLFVLAFSRAGGNEYVDQNTVVLGIALSAQSQIALWLERRRRDPFVILLAFSMTFYYLFRLLTLTLYPFSLVFQRYSYNASDSNYALIFIIIASMFLYAGFYAVPFNANRVIRPGRWSAASPGRAILLISVAIIVAYSSGMSSSEANIPRVFNFLIIFLSQNIVLLMAMSYYFIYRKSLTKKVGVTIGMLIAIDMAAHTLVGSRSAIVGILQNYILVALGIAGCIQFRRKYFVLGLVLLPVVAALLVGSFAISTYNRANRESTTSLDVSRALELASESSSSLSVDSALDTVVPLLAARAGFFDFSAEIIAHRDQYSSVINLPSYAKSIVDNILTPGFDVYDQPKISNALKFVYEGIGTPSKEQVTESYQSDQLGLYGELYALFDYASLPLFFLLAFYLKLIYVRLRSENPFIFVMKRVIVLFVFVRTLDSYGFDWTILETLPLIAAIYIYRFFFSSKAFSIGNARPRLALADTTPIG
jgi:hypothetical protein